MKKIPTQTDLTKLEGDPSPRGDALISLSITHDSDGTTTAKLEGRGPHGSQMGSAIAMSLLIMVSTVPACGAGFVAQLVNTSGWATALTSVLVFAASAAASILIMKPKITKPAETAVQTPTTPPTPQKLAPRAKPRGRTRARRSKKRRR